MPMKHQNSRRRDSVSESQQWQPKMSFPSEQLERGARRTKRRRPTAIQLHQHPTIHEQHSCTNGSVQKPCTNQLARMRWTERMVPRRVPRKSGSRSRKYEQCLFQLWTDRSLCQELSTEVRTKYPVQSH